MVETSGSRAQPARGRRRTRGGDDGRRRSEALRAPAGSARNPSGPSSLGRDERAAERAARSSHAMHESRGRREPPEPSQSARGGRGSGQRAMSRSGDSREGTADDHSASARSGWRGRRKLSGGPWAVNRGASGVPHEPVRQGARAGPPEASPEGGERRVARASPAFARPRQQQLCPGPCDPQRHWCCAEGAGEASAGVGRTTPDKATATKAATTFTPGVAYLRCIRGSTIASEHGARPRSKPFYGSGVAAPPCNSLR